MPCADPAVILTVCTGNICRSPYMQFTLAAALSTAGLSGITVSSAGVRAVPDAPVADHMASLLAGEGIDTRGFSTHRLMPELIAGADLILTADRTHRREVAIMAPQALPRIFTLLQFARLVPLAVERSGTGHDLDAAAETASLRLRSLVTRSSAARGVAQPAPGTADDIADPWGHSRSAYRDAADTMRPAIDVIVAALTGHGPESVS